jgi:hypothetical protein
MNVVKVWLRSLGEYPGPRYPAEGGQMMAPGATTPERPNTPPAPPSVPHVALVRELEATIAELNEERRRSQAFAARLVKLRARLLMSPSEAHRNNLALQERLDEQRAANERLELRVAELEGHAPQKGDAS